MTDINSLAARYGLGESYYDFRGQFTVFSAASRRAILQAMGALDENKAPQTASDISVWVCSVDQPTLTFDLQDVTPTSIKVTLQLESGDTTSHTLPLQREASGAGAVTLPTLPLGYHQISLTCANKTFTGRLIITPTRSYEPEVMQQDQRQWGLSIQLYTLRTDNNYGIGDFADLQALIKQAAPLGCSTLGLNPLHALRPADPGHFSPYSPSHRQFLNVLYIAPSLSPEHDVPAVQAQVRSMQAQLKTLRATTCVDYQGVAAIKLPLFKLMFAAVKQNKPRYQALQQFVQQQGPALRLHALYDALDAHFSKQKDRYWGWRSWPEEFHDHHGKVVQDFATRHADEVEFYLYLQWLAAEQLAHTQQQARNSGMTLGLYGDVAVGVDANGSEVWSNRALYVEGVSVGAPPDPLALKGQEWGIPPQHPLQLQAQQYEPFIQMVRANMQSYGSLRIDHVMTLCRLWWVPRGFDATQGVYVSYPLDDLINIVALESVRNQCLVIGEDLGTVPDAMRNAMHRTGLYHYKVLFFEKTADGGFMRPAAYVPTSLAVVTTHDLPTFISWWTGDDIALREALKLYPSDQARDQVKQEREHDRRALMQGLADTGLWHWQAHDALPEASFALMRAAYLYAGLSRARLLVIQPEDLQGMTEPVNVPGTSTEHANWQRKLQEDLSATLQQPAVIEFLQAMNKARRGEFPNQY